MFTILLAYEGYLRYTRIFFYLATSARLRSTSLFALTLEVLSHENICEEHIRIPTVLLRLYVRNIQIS